MVELLLNAGAPLDPEDAFDPLDMAAMAGQLDVARVLLSSGADPNGTDRPGQPLR